MFLLLYPALQIHDMNITNVVCGVCACQTGDHGAGKIIPKSNRSPYVFCGKAGPTTQLHCLLQTQGTIQQVNDCLIRVKDFGFAMYHLQPASQIPIGYWKWIMNH